MQRIFRKMAENSLNIQYKGYIYNVMTNSTAIISPVAKMHSNNSITILNDASPKQLPPSERSVRTEAAASCSKESVTFQNIPSLFQMVLAEFIGTFFLIFVGCGAGMTDKVLSLTMLGIAFVWGMVLMVAIYSFGHISGAHFNPAVSIALASIRKFPWKHVPMYILAQLLAGIVASLMLTSLYHGQAEIHAVVNQYSTPTSDLQAFTWEFIITFILMTTICAVAIDDRVNNDLCGVAIGGTLFFNAMIAGPITGASMNPARSIGPAIVAGSLKNLWVFILSPILGALAGAMVHGLLRLPKAAKSEHGATGSYNNLSFQADP